jgi:hypothetical protein
LANFNLVSIKIIIRIIIIFRGDTISILCLSRITSVQVK